MRLTMKELLQNMPKQYIEVAAYYIWQQRVDAGRDGTAEDDWYQAEQQLEDERGK